MALSGPTLALLGMLAERIEDELQLRGGLPLASLSEERLIRLLVDLDLDAGRLEASLQALAACDASAAHWVHAGWRLEKGLQPLLALRAFHEALRRDPQHGEAYEGLARLDPAAALVALERRPLGHHAEARAWRATERARLLLACGREHDALVELRSLPIEAATCDSYWELFSKLAPREAVDSQGERALRSGDGNALVQYARNLHARGEIDAALELLTQPWDDEDLAATMLAALCDLDPVHAHGALRARLAERPDDGNLWQRLGESAYELGDVEGALDAWMQALRIDPWACDDYEQLWQHRREPFLQAFWQGALREESDWIWEECGDWLWRSGRSQQALDAWSQAVRLDPDDASILTKIERAHSGRWPL